MAFTGLRSSELRGLRWKDIDFKASQLHVRQRADRFNKIGAPKSEKSVRTVPVDTVTLDASRFLAVGNNYQPHYVGAFVPWACCLRARK